MRYGLFIMFIIWSIHPSVGQDIEKILLVSLAGDEPPTKSGPSKYTMTFEINSDEDFIATQIKRDNKRRELSESQRLRRNE